MDFHPQAAEDTRAGHAFAPLSATSLSALRLRFNMNTVRLPMDIDEAGAAGYFAALAKVVRRANQLELLVILAAREPGNPVPSSRAAEFWSRCATAFKDYPNVIFDAFPEPSTAVVPSGVDPHSAAGWEIWRDLMTPLVRAIRGAGAAQPIVLASWNDERMFEGAAGAPMNDSNIVYGISPHYATTSTDAQREARFGFLARQVPVTANGWDLELDDPTACAAIPSDPGAVNEMVRANLEDLDTRRISWTMSVLEPGKLVKELYFFHGTLLDSGWTCGPQKDSGAGIGRVIEGYLRSTEDRSIFVVGSAGGLDVSRGGFANGYGPVMAEQDARAHGRRLPLSLGGIAVEVTDSAGVSRRAGIYWVSAGWGQVDFVVPEESRGGKSPRHVTTQRRQPSAHGDHDCRYRSRIPHAHQLRRTGGGNRGPGVCRRTCFHEAPGFV
ncbi:MAG: glycoside hydrolase family 5 protein [Bryobacteraceae bacterium]